MGRLLKWGLFCTLGPVVLLGLIGCSGFLEVYLHNRTDEPTTVEFLTMECKVTVPANSEVNTGCKHLTEDIGLRYKPANASDWVAKEWRYKDLSGHALRHSRFNLDIP